MQKLETWKEILEERIRTKKSKRAIVSYYNKKVFVRFGRKQYSFEGTKETAHEIANFLKEKGYIVLNYYETSPIMGYSSTRGYFVEEEERYFCELKRVDFSEWTPPTF